MADTDFSIFTNYMPVISEIPETKIQDTRSRMVTYLAGAWPSLDTRPGSPFGDLQMTPLATLVAGLEIAAARWRSDVTLENVADGIIYDCDFVREFLTNFIGDQPEGLFAMGTIRLIFNSDTPVEIDRGVKLSFTDEANIFYFKLPSPGGLLLKPVGSQLSYQMNTWAFSQVGAGQYAVDLMVYGQMTTQVIAGDSGSITTLPAGLQSIVALTDFYSGSEPITLPVLAKRSRTTSYSATLSNRIGAHNLVQKEFPIISNVSAAMPDDDEIVRDTISPLGISNGAMDIFCKSPQYGLTDSATVRVNYVVAQDAVAVGKFIGLLNFPSLPLRATKISWIGDPDISLYANPDAVRIFARSQQAGMPLFSAGFSGEEKFWLIIDMPKDPSSGVALVDLQVDSSGQAYAEFKVEYQCEPLQASVLHYLNSPDVLAANMDVRVRGFLPIVFDRLVVKYKRKSGTEFKLAQAQQEIFTYLNALGWPDVFSEGVVADAMKYAGAQQYVGLSIFARLLWSCANYHLHPADPDPDVNFALADAGKATALQMSIINPGNLVPQYKDINLGTGDATYEACGPRNIAYLLAQSDITFQEIQ